MDVKKNFMQAFKELTGNEEETDEKVAVNGAKTQTENKQNQTEEKAAFSSAFDSIKAHYTESAEPAPSPLVNNNQPKAQQQAKPAFTPINTGASKPFVNNNKNSQFNNNNNQAKFDKPADVKPAETKEPEKPAAEEKPAAVAATTAPVVDTPVKTPPVEPAPADTDDFINTFLKARGTDPAVAEEKTKEIKTNMEKALFHPDASVSSDTTIITEGTEITGTITTSNSIIIGGTVSGDVTTAGKITIYGKVEGNIKCKTADLSDCEVIGDIDTEEHLIITENTKIDGDIKTSSIEIDGKVKGNITSSNSIHIMTNALVIGDIVASKLSIEEGAMIQGSVSMNFNM